MNVDTRLRMAAEGVKVAVGNQLPVDVDRPRRTAHRRAIRNRIVGVALVVALVGVSLPLVRNVLHEEQQPIGRIQDGKHGDRPDRRQRHESSTKNAVAGLSPGSEPGVAPQDDDPARSRDGTVRSSSARIGRIVYSTAPAAGTAATTTENADQIVVINENGTGARSLGDGSRPDFSRDGRIAFVRYDQACVAEAYPGTSEEPCAEIWTMRRDGSGRRRIGSGTSPDWSPDGKRIAFVRYRDPNSESRHLHVMNADGSGSRPIGRVQGQAPNWSPDGRKIAYMTPPDDDSCMRIRLTNLDGKDLGEVREPELPGYNCFNGYPSFSPDGRRIAFAASRGANTLDIGISVIDADLDPSSLRRLTPKWDGSEPRHALAPSWSPEGKRVAYMLDPDGSTYGQSSLYCNARYFMRDSVNCRPPGPMDSDIYVMNADGKRARRVVQGHLPDFAP